MRSHTFVKLTSVVLQKMRGDKTGREEDYKMVSVPGKVGGALDGMSAARLRQELEALRESEKWTGLPLHQQKADVKQRLRKLGTWFAR